MRVLTAADLAVLASQHYAVHVRVLVTDADGVERDLTDLEGIDWFAGAEWSARRLYIGSRGTEPGVYEYEALKVYAGRLSGTPEQLMAYARGEI